MAALWVQDQSGGRTRIVLLGRPKRWAERFALIVAPRQFKIPPRDNLRPARPAADARRPGRRGRGRRGLARAARRPAAATDRGAGRRRDQAVPLRCRGRRRRSWPNCAGSQAARRRHALSHRPAGARGPTWWRRWTRGLPPGAMLHRWSAEAAATTIPISACWPRRPVRRHRRQRLDDGRGGEPGPAAGDLRAAGRAQPRRSGPRPGSPISAPAACSAGWPICSIAWASPAMRRDLGEIQAPADRARPGGAAGRSRSAARPRRWRTSCSRWSPAFRALLA